MVVCFVDACAGFWVGVGTVVFTGFRLGCLCCLLSGLLLCCGVFVLFGV